MDGYINTIEIPSIVIRGMIKIIMRQKNKDWFFVCLSKNSMLYLKCIQGLFGREKITESSKIDRIRYDETFSETRGQYFYIILLLPCTFNTLQFHIIMRSIIFQVLLIFLIVCF